MSIDIFEHQEMIARRVNEFVVQRAGEALLWMFESDPEKPMIVPFQHVEFETRDKSWDGEPVRTEYGMRMYIGEPEGVPSLARLKQSSVASIVIYKTVGLNLSLHDENNILRPLLGDIDDESDDRFRAMETLVDELENLKTAGRFIPAGKRQATELLA